MAREGRDQGSVAKVAADATRDAARLQKQGTLQAARIGRSGTIRAARINMVGALGVAVIASLSMVINTSVQGCYSLQQARLTVRVSAAPEPAGGSASRYEEFTTRLQEVVRRMDEDPNGLPSSEFEAATVPLSTDPNITSSWCYSVGSGNVLQACTESYFLASAPPNGEF